MQAPATALGGGGGDRGECPLVVQPRHGGYWASEQNHSEQCLCPGLTGTDLTSNVLSHFQSMYQTICPHSCLRKCGIRFFNKKVDPNHRTAAESQVSSSLPLNSASRARGRGQTAAELRPGCLQGIKNNATPRPSWELDPNNSVADCFLRHSCNQP